MGIEKLLEKLSSEAKQNNNLRNVYERYFFSIFQKSTKISKIPEGTDPTPDFKIILNGKEFIAEVKGLDPIYEHAWEIFEEVCKEMGRRDLIEKFALDVTPFNIHRDDIEKVKDGLKERLKEFLDEGIKNDNILFQIDANIRTYTFKIIKLERERGFSIGEYMKEISNLRNVLRGNEQYERIHFLTLINLNPENDKDRFIEEVLHSKTWALPNGNRHKTIQLLTYNIFNSYPNILFILFIDPNIEAAFIIISPCLKEDISCEIYHLVHILRSEGLKVYLNSVSTEWVEFK